VGVIRKIAIEHELNRLIALNHKVRQDRNRFIEKIPIDERFVMPRRVRTVDDENDVLILEKIDEVLDHHDVIRQRRLIDAVGNNITNVVSANRKMFHAETLSVVTLEVGLSDGWSAMVTVGGVGVVVDNRLGALGPVDLASGLIRLINRIVFSSKTALVEMLGDRVATIVETLVIIRAVAGVKTLPDVVLERSMAFGRCPRLGVERKRTRRSRGSTLVLLTIRGSMGRRTRKRE
jgi:hypothetical protein